MIDRCKRICGTIDGPCYINSKQQINCLSDMVINKTAGISMILSFTIGEGDRDIADMNIREAVITSNELSNWVKYIGVARDLQEVSQLVLDSDTKEKRREIRYPLPVGQERKVGVELPTASGPVQATLLNFSQSGMRVTSPQALEVGSSVTGSVYVSHDSERREPFTMVVKYVGEGEGGGYTIGGQIEQLAGMRDFNFFESIYGCLMKSNVFDHDGFEL
jgi:hypothetical protein